MSDMTWRERLFGISIADDGVRLVRLEAADVRNLKRLQDHLGVTAPEAASVAIQEALARRDTDG